MVPARDEYSSPRTKLVRGDQPARPWGLAVVLGDFSNSKAGMRRNPPRADHSRRSVLQFALRFPFVPDERNFVREWSVMTKIRPPIRSFRRARARKNFRVFVLLDSRFARFPRATWRTRSWQTDQHSVYNDGRLAWIRARTHVFCSAITTPCAGRLRNPDRSGCTKFTSLLPTRTY